MRAKNQIKRISQKKSVKITLGVLFFLIALRLALPSLCKSYINSVLKDNIKGYIGHIEDFDFTLWRGAYQMQGFQLNKLKAEIPVPFLSAKQIDFTIAWRPLWRGHVVGRVTLNRFQANFVNGPSAAQKQSGVEGEGWQRTVDALFPLEIEELELKDSELHFRDFTRSPKVDLYLQDINGSAFNLTNTSSYATDLVSTYNLKATIQKKGKLESTGKFSLLETPIPFDINLEAEEIEIAEFNDFFKSYANFDAAKGRLDVYLEVAATEGKVKGYVKPLLTNASILRSKNSNDDDATGTDILASVANLLIRRYSKDQAGAKIPFEGNINNPEVEVWASVKSMFQHAFGKGLQAKVDEEIDIEDPKKLR